MKPLLIFISTLIITASIKSQSDPPPERFSLEGAITIGASDTPLPPDGTIRWNPITEDFEGYNGREWLSLTSGSSSFGNTNPYRYEDEILVAPDGRAGLAFGEDVAIEDQYYAVGVPHYNSSEGIVYIYENGVLKNAVAVPGSNELGERVDISGEWMVIGTDDLRGYAYNLNEDKLITLKQNGMDRFSEFIKIDGEFIAVKGIDSMVYTYQLQGGDWDEIGVVSNKSIPLSSFDISENGLYANLETAIDEVVTYEFSGSSWEAISTNPALPMGYKATAPSLHETKMAVAYRLDASLANNADNDVALVKIYNYNGDSWVEEGSVEIPGEISIGPAIIHGNTVILNSGITGAPTDQVLHNGQGMIHVIQKEFGIWKYKNKITSSDGKAGDIFGQDYDLDDTGIIVGALWADLYLNTIFESIRQGKVYIFKK